MPVRASIASPSRPPLATLGRAGAVALLGSLVLAVSAHVAVPFWPVPMTLQTLVVLLLGGLAGPRLGALAVLAYGAEGMLGLPVFAHGTGVATLVGPTGGYIVGFLPAAMLAGLAARCARDARGVASAAVLMLLADGLILVLGVTWLATLVGWDKAVAAGLLPFLLGEAVKVALATIAVQMRTVPRG